jgi:ORF6N domain-containing protein
MAKKNAIMKRAVEGRILLFRGHKVLLDSDLAELYGVSVKQLNQQVKRNSERFPPDFMFRLTLAENKILRSQNATSSEGHGGRRYLPFAFTEHGAIMAASVLNSPRAIEMSVFVVRAFVRLREMLTTNRELAEKLKELEGRLETHDEAIQEIFDAIKRLMQPSEVRKQIGFQTGRVDGA